MIAAPSAGAPDLLALMTRERWIEVVRIVATGVVALLFWRGLVPIQLLWAAVAVGLYPLVKTGLLDLFRERKVGTEIFVTVATLVAVFGGETVAGAVLMVIILIAESIAELNTERARASIKALIGSVPQVALVRGVCRHRRRVGCARHSHRAAGHRHHLCTHHRAGRKRRVGAGPGAEARRQGGGVADPGGVRVPDRRLSRHARCANHRHPAHLHLAGRAGPGHAAGDDRRHRPCGAQRHPDQGWPLSRSAGQGRCDGVRQDRHAHSQPP